MKNMVSRGCAASNNRTEALGKGGTYDAERVQELVLAPLDLGSAVEEDFLALVVGQLLQAQQPT